MTTLFLNSLYFTASLVARLKCQFCFFFFIIFVRSLVSQGRFFLSGILPLGIHFFIVSLFRVSIQLQVQQVRGRPFLRGRKYHTEEIRLALSPRPVFEERDPGNEDKCYTGPHLQFSTLQCIYIPCTNGVGLVGC